MKKKDEERDEKKPDGWINAGVALGGSGLVTD